MELTKAIYERRSIRQYTYKEVSDEEIKELVAAAQMAPSWKNTETARFYVAKSEKAISDVRGMLASFNKERTEGVGAFIVSTVVKGESGYVRGEPTHLGNGFECFDNGLAVENLLLKAYEMGYGTLIMGLYHEKEIREYFEIPDSEAIVVVIALGKADICPETPQRKELDSILTIK
ncbi:MAG: nitroreductase family protein [Clostridia bacterium]|nr:nitroreductase family protein [Clostridia bacterium]